MTVVANNRQAKRVTVVLSSEKPTLQIARNGSDIFSSIQSILILTITPALSSSLQGEDSKKCPTRSFLQDRHKKDFFSPYIFICFLFFMLLLFRNDLLNFNAAAGPRGRPMWGQKSSYTIITGQPAFLVGIAHQNSKLILIIQEVTRVRWKALSSRMKAVQSRLVTGLLLILKWITVNLKE